jgi:hypothetical protein
MPRADNMTPNRLIQSIFAAQCTLDESELLTDRTEHAVTLARLWALLRCRPKLVREIAQEITRVERANRTNQRKKTNR